MLLFLLTIINTFNVWFTFNARANEFSDGVNGKIQTSLFRMARKWT